MYKKIRNSKGFTIVETLIVIAIGATILIVALIAVPQLNRSAKNTSIKADATHLSAGITDFTSNNNGAIPNTAVQSASTGGTVTLQIGSPATSTNNPTVNVSSSAVVTYKNVANATTNAPTLSKNNLYLAFGADCAASGSAMKQDSSGVAIFYAVDNGGTVGTSCIQA